MLTEATASRPAHAAHRVQSARVARGNAWALACARVTEEVRRDDERPRAYAPPAARTSLTPEKLRGRSRPGRDEKPRAELCLIG
jgi:hypothetical protein